MPYISLDFTVQHTINASVTLLLKKIKFFVFWILKRIYSNIQYVTMVNETLKNSPDTGSKPDFRERLGDTILEVFSESDFHAVGIRDIAQKAGVSFATIYKYYGSKEQLVFSFVDLWMGVLTDRIIDHLHGMADLKEKLRKIFWLQLDYYERHEEFAKIIFLTMPMKTWMSDESFEQHRMFDLLMDVLRQGQEEGILNDQIDTRILLDFMMGFVQRSFMMWIQRGKKAPLSSQTDIMFDMIWQGIQPPAAPDVKANSTDKKYNR